MATRFDGGSPVSTPSNPFNRGAGLESADILPSLDPEGHERDVMGDLDAYGSNPSTSDALAQRPLNPPTSANSSTM